MNRHDRLNSMRTPSEEGVSSRSTPSTPSTPETLDVHDVLQEESLRALLRHEVTLGRSGYHALMRPYLAGGVTLGHSGRPYASRSTTTPSTSGGVRYETVLRWALPSTTAGARGEGRSTSSSMNASRGWSREDVAMVAESMVQESSSTGAAGDTRWRFSTTSVLESWSSFLPMRVDTVAQGRPVVVVAVRPDRARRVRGRLGPLMPDSMATSWVGSKVLDPEAHRASRESLTSWKGSTVRFDSGALTLRTQHWVHGRLTNFRGLRSMVLKYRDTPSVEVKSSTHRRFAVHFEPREPLRTVGKRPALVIFLHPVDHRVAVEEVASMGIPMAGVLNSDFPMRDKVDYPLRGNDRSLRSQRLRMSRRASGMKEGRHRRATTLKAVDSASHQSHPSHEHESR